jgi:putative addiction module component (TIGR02574 family)
MSMTLEEHPDLQRLTAQEKLELAYALWADPEVQQLESPVDEALKAELDRRWAEYERDPSTASTWEEVEARLLGRRKAK